MYAGEMDSAERENWKLRCEKETEASRGETVREKRKEEMREEKPARIVQKKSGLRKERAGERKRIIPEAAGCHSLFPTVCRLSQ